MSAPVLVAGVGNVFFGDDGFGVEVVRRLAGEAHPPEVEVADYGIRGVHLAYRLLDPPSLLVLVDALRRGAPPGTLCVLDPEVEPLAGIGLGDGHALDVASVLASVRALGGTLPEVRLVGCEPEQVEARIGLGPAVALAVPQAVLLVRDLVWRFLEAARRSPSKEEPSCGAGTGLHS